jgi:hypothetical protein
VQQQLRRLRVMSIVGSILWVALIALAKLSIVGRNWWQLLYVAFLLLMGLSNLSLNRRTLRMLRESQPGDSSSSAAP